MVQRPRGRLPTLDQRTSCARRSRPRVTWATTLPYAANRPALLKIEPAGQDRGQQASQTVALDAPAAPHRAHDAGNDDSSGDLMILTVNRPCTARTPLSVGVRHRNAIDLIPSLRLLRRMKRAPRPARLATAVMRILLVVIAFGASATAATDFTQSATQTSATQAQVSFTPTTPATFVDLHYLP